MRRHGHSGIYIFEKFPVSQRIFLFKKNRSQEHSRAKIPGSSFKSIRRDTLTAPRRVPSNHPHQKMHGTNSFVPVDTKASSDPSTMFPIDSASMSGAPEALRVVCEICYLEYYAESVQGPHYCPNCGHEQPDPR